MSERDTDYTDEDRELWEESLKEAIFAAQAKLRLGSSSRIGGAALLQEAEAMGIGRERLHRIRSAADAGFDWDNTVFDMERNGMSRRAAEEVTERLAADIFVRRVLDGDLSDSRERAKLIWSIAAIFAIVLTAIFAWRYWVWLSAAADSVHQWFGSSGR